MTISVGRTHFLLQVWVADMDIKSMFWDPNKGLIDRFGDLMDPIDTPKAFKRLKKNLWLNTMVLTNMTTFGVAVGATVLEVEVEVEDGYQRQKYFYWVVAHVQGFQIHIIWPPNSSISVRYNGLYTEHDLAPNHGGNYLNYPQLR